MGTNAHVTQLKGGDVRDLNGMLKNLSLDGMEDTNRSLERSGGLEGQLVTTSSVEIRQSKESTPSPRLADAA
jgi:hypothetical protein